MVDLTTSTEKSAKYEAVQAEIDRVAARQHGATDGTVRDELHKGLGETGVDLDDEAVEKLAAAIEADDGPVDAAKLI
jgi:hypothetical protein